MPDIDPVTSIELAEALAKAGLDPAFRTGILEALRIAQAAAADPQVFRETVRWPLIRALFRDLPAHRVQLRDGAVFEVSLASRIERSLLLSTQRVPDHVWEPQTTRLLCMLSDGAEAVIIGGAYIGDHAVIIGSTLRRNNSPGIVHAFEPMLSAYRRLVRNIELSHLSNVRPRCAALWSESGLRLQIEGDAALASSHQASTSAGSGVGEGETAPSLTIDDYVSAERIPSVGLIMLDVEGGEEQALRGARAVLTSEHAPNIVFEIHRSYVDWGEGLLPTSIVALLVSHGYELFAIRDFHDNLSMAGTPIEIVPAASVYLEGPAHGFNMLATRDPNLVARLGLRIVENVSPKLLLDRDPALHHPLSWSPSRPVVGSR